MRQRPASGVRVLEVLRMIPRNPGGIENFVLRAVESMDRTGLKTDFLSAYSCADRAYADRVDRIGGTMYTLAFRHGMGKPAMFVRMVRFLKAHAGEYRLDPDRFALGGDSAKNYTLAKEGQQEYGYRHARLS